MSYIDDVAIPVLASASELIQKTSETAAVAVDVFLCYAMQLNFASNKSEAVPLFRGAGARTAKKLLHEADSRIILQTRSNVSHALRFVRVYKHVGTKF